MKVNLKVGSKTIRFIPKYINCSWVIFDKLEFDTCAVYPSESEARYHAGRMNSAEALETDKNLSKAVKNLKKT